MLTLPVAWALEPDESLLIEARASIDASREAVGVAIREQGYLQPMTLGSRSYYIHPRIWKPRVMLTDEGLARVRTWRVTPLSPLASSRPRDPDAYLPLSINDAMDQGLESVTGTGMTGMWSSQRTKTRMEADVLEGFEYELIVWREAIWALSALHRVGEIQAQLFETWEDSARSHAARRAALLEMWLNTADNDAGERVRAQIEVFIDDFVQPSPHPLTPAEIASANARRAFSRELAPVAQ